MSNLYSLKSVVDIPLQEQAIKKILIKGAEIGCRYVNENKKIWGASFLSPEQALHHIMRPWREETQEYSSPISSGIDIKFEDIGFSLNFTERSGFLAPWLSLYRHGWCKESSYVDFEKYTYVLFELVQDFTVLWLKTYDEGYDEELYSGNALSYPQFRKKPDLSLLPQFKAEVTIIPEYNHETLCNLLEHGTKQGWYYYSLNDQTNPIAAEQAAAYILRQSPTGHTEANLISMVHSIQYRATFKLRINTYFMFVLEPMNTLLVDLKQTVSHALELCTDFCILELNTFDARYNYIRSTYDEVL